jgi:hypothetical protein
VEVSVSVALVHQPTTSVLFECRRRSTHSLFSECKCWLSLDLLVSILTLCLPHSVLKRIGNYDYGLPHQLEEFKQELKYLYFRVLSQTNLSSNENGDTVKYTFKYLHLTSKATCLTPIL